MLLRSFKIGKQATITPNINMNSERASTNISVRIYHTPHNHNRIGKGWPTSSASIVLNAYKHKNKTTQKSVLQDFERRRFSIQQYEASYHILGFCLVYFIAIFCSYINCDRTWKTFNIMNSHHIIFFLKFWCHYLKWLHAKKLSRPPSYHSSQQIRFSAHKIVWFSIFTTLN